MDLAPAHRHGVYAVEEVLRTDGLRGPELLAAVFADEDYGKCFGGDAESLSWGVCVGRFVEEGRGDEVPVLELGLPALQEVALAEVSFVRIGWGEDQEQAVLAAVWCEAGVQDCSRARLAVSCVALA